MTNEQDGFATEFGETEMAVRGDSSWEGRIVFWAGISISLLHIYFNTLGTFSEQTTSSLHFGTFGLLCALLFPMVRTRSATRRNLFAVFDLAVGLAVLASAFYLIAMEDALFARGVKFIASDWVVSVVAVVALSYVVWRGRYVGGMFQFPGLSVESMLFRGFFGGDGMFGPIARISSTYVFMFILFGAFLVRSGTGEFIINLSRCVAGRFTGGPGLVAVLGSGLMGSISGSAVANTVTTGVITIPS